MPVIDTDIVVYGSANMQETDSGTQGGAIDLTTLIVFTDLTENTTITVVSDNAGDTTQTLTVTGRIADGSIDTEVLSLNGTTPDVGATTFERVLKLELSASTTGSVTVTETSGADEIAVITAGVTTVRRPFYNVSADVSGGSEKNYYEKIFFKNENGSLALTSATIEEVAGGVASNVEFTLETTLDGSGTSTDRTTAPSTGVGTFSSSAQNVANSQNHSAGAAQGVWLHLTLPAGTSATNSTYTLKETGQTV